MTLIERIEAATGPDRELDAEIALAVGIVSERDGNVFYGNRDYSVMVMERGYYDIEGSAPELPHLTSSIDDALTLMPEGAPWRIEFDGDLYYVEMYKPHGRRFTGHMTVPLVICAAALYAREDNA